MMCAVHEVYKKKNPQEMRHDKTLEEKTRLKFDGLPFPMTLDALNDFEELNDNQYSVNVFGLRDAVGDESKQRSTYVYPLRVSTVSKPELHVNLLLLKADGKSHYVLVKDFDRLMFGQYSKHANNKHLCHNCLHCFKKGTH